MKKLIIYLIIILNVSLTIAQEIIVPIENETQINIDPNESYYFKDVNNTLDKFVGTWVFDNGSDFFEVTFSIVNYYNYGQDLLESNKRYDILTSKFIYKLNGVEVYNTYLQNQPTYMVNPLKISGSLVDSNNNNKINMVYSEPMTDIRKSNFAFLEIIYSNTIGMFNNEQLNWNVTNKIGEIPPIWMNFRIPLNMILIKQ